MHIIKVGFSSTILFVYGLFNDAVSSSDCVRLNDRATNEQRFVKDTEGSGCGLV
jgi:hypothetical protein